MVKLDSHIKGPKKLTEEEARMLFREVIADTVYYYNLMVTIELPNVEVLYGRR